MKPLLALLLSTSLFACVAEPTDVETEVAELAENPPVDLDGEAGDHVDPGAGNELPDGPGIAPRRPEGLHLSTTDEKATVDALAPAPEPRDVRPTTTAEDFDPRRTPGADHVDGDELAELFERARGIAGVRGATLAR